MNLADGANWATILGGVLVAGSALVGFLMWLTAIYWNGRTTQRSVAKLERELEHTANKAEVNVHKLARFLRRHARKSDKFHQGTDAKLGQIDIRLENHEQRIVSAEHRLTEDEKRISENTARCGPGAPPARHSGDG